MMDDAWNHEAHLRGCRPRIAARFPAHQTPSPVELALLIAKRGSRPDSESGAVVAEDSGHAWPSKAVHPDASATRTSNCPAAQFLRFSNHIQSDRRGLTLLCSLASFSSPICETRAPVTNAKSLPRIAR